MILILCSCVYGDGDNEHGDNGLHCDLDFINDNDMVNL